MKYMLLVYTDEKSWAEDERANCYAESAQLCQDLQSRGQYVSASPLQPVVTVTSVRVRNGKPVIKVGTVEAHRRYHEPACGCGVHETAQAA